uniref:Antitoxin component of toxin-antitoxin stability system, DNA-binding transcriptional repressor n=1 Tax=Candidatus Kentrum sp. LFY TaxID=2126342 RepID=A0A450V7J8_9GAMM|nr:MAG: hypothetical protein BECKLFY1418B_GA0070995_108911 [Candidatus Kentron sp. LFY]VFK00758.1 MAG: hypothetical protein BECKLFY1418A_GA0070994_11246 [Candidatus Kentron sp. LFY]VFK23307.1 MAG: hypothetical protein BECKLFY1418C_GA0070996_11394 [Candidatus Kentron sp. LFY]
MEASILDLRYKMKDVLCAVDRNEVVAITYRGKTKAILKPVPEERSRIDPTTHPFFGMNHPTEGDTSLDDLRRERFDI